MGFRAAQWAIQQDGLDDKAHWVLVRLAWSVLDDDGFLDRSPNWLADKTHMSERALRRQILFLEKLHLIRRERNGYQLCGFLEAIHQARPVSAPLERPKMATPLEPPIRNEISELRENPPTPLAGGPTKIRRRDRELRIQPITELRVFYTAVCNCNGQVHEWPVPEPYCDLEQRSMWCPEARALLGGVR